MATGEDDSRRWGAFVVMLLIEVEGAILEGVGIDYVPEFGWEFEKGGVLGGSHYCDVVWSVK